MIRIFAFLMVCTLIFSCTNTETETVTQVDKDQIENSADIVEKQTEVSEEDISKEKITKTEETQEAQPISESKIVETKEKTVSPKTYSSKIVAVGSIALNTEFMSEEEVAEFNRNSDNNLTNIEYELPSANDIAALRELLDGLDDGVLGFAVVEDTTTKVKIGAFDEVISVTKSGEDVTEEIMFKENSVNKKSLEYIRRPKPLVEYSGYKIELMTVYNQSLDLNDPLFKTFGGLMFKNNTMNSTTYYLGDFRDTTALDDYLQKVVKSRFPKAKGVKFENGVEVKYK